MPCSFQGNRRVCKFLRLADSREPFEQPFCAPSVDGKVQRIQHISPEVREQARQQLAQNAQELGVASGSVNGEQTVQNDIEANVCSRAAPQQQEDAISAHFDATNMRFPQHYEELGAVPLDTTLDS